MPGPASPPRSPKSSRALVDEYFIENRTRLLEIAAYLDRLDRADAAADDNDGGGDDFRMRAFREALAVLAEREAGRTTRVQLLFSDATTEPLAALDVKSARGAYDRWAEEVR